MLRRGFTLAEVLITIGIIGVVAALSTPAIMQNTQNAKIGPQLAKLSTTVETGIQAIMTDQEKKYFKDVVHPDNNDVSVPIQIDAIVGNYIKARKYTETVPPFKNLSDGANFAAEGFNTTINSTYIFSDKSAIAIPDCTLGDDGNGNINDYCVFYGMMPAFANKAGLVMGKDVFPFFVTKEGHILTPTEIGLDDSNDECTEDNVLNRTTTGAFCVDKIAENGWKVHY